MPDTALTSPTVSPVI